MIACAKGCGFLFRRDFKDEMPTAEEITRWRCPNCLGALRHVAVEFRRFRGSSGHPAPAS